MVYKAVQSGLFSLDAALKRKILIEVFDLEKSEDHNINKNKMSISMHPLTFDWYPQLSHAIYN